MPLSWNLGLVVHDADGAPWVYIGWRRTSVGTTERIFVKARSGPGYSAPPWTYQAVYRPTLVKKFPDLAVMWPEVELSG